MLRSWRKSLTALAAVLLLAAGTYLGGCGKMAEPPDTSPGRGQGEAVGARPPAPPAEALPHPPPPPPPPPLPEAPAPDPAQATPPEMSAPACASDDLAPFPWPSPPQPSVSALVPRRLLFGGDDSARSLAAVGARLDGAIAAAGYLQPKYLGAGCDGFAIMLDLEHIEADGTRMSGTAGFAPPGQDEPFKLASYIRRLFYAPPGHYRQIVLVVSDQRLAGTTPPPSEAELRSIARDGASVLPAAFAAVPFSPRHEVTALIYEFEKGPLDGDARVIPPDGRLGATVHLKKAQIY